MEKRGLFSVGYIADPKTILPELLKKTGVNWIDFNVLDTNVENVWNKGFYGNEGIICYDKDDNELTGSFPETDIAWFLIDTGFKTPDNSAIYYKFKRNLMRPGWNGAGFTAGELDDYTCIASDTIYDNIAYSIYQQSGEKLDKASCKKLLFDSFREAKKKNRLAKAENDNKTKAISFFPVVGNDAIENAGLYIKMEKNAYSGVQAWYGAFVYAWDDLKAEILSLYRFHIGDFVFDGKKETDEFFENVAKAAIKENWDYPDGSGKVSHPILRSYLEHTYYRLKDLQEGKANGEYIYENGGKVFFNTGLLNRYFNELYIVGQIEKLTKTIEGYGDINWELVKPLECREIRLPDPPKMATYFEKTTDAVFDANLEIYTNDDHIYYDGLANNRLPSYAKKYEAVKDNSDKLDDLVGSIHKVFNDTALKRAALMAQRNYKIAVPQFYRGQNACEMQFLLPIYLKDKMGDPECVLVLRLEKDDDGNPCYNGVTILNLSMAYNNARLIAKPEVSWLEAATRSSRSGKNSPKP